MQFHLAIGDLFCPVIFLDFRTLHVSGAHLMHRITLLKRQLTGDKPWFSGDLLFYTPCPWVIAIRLDTQETHLKKEYLKEDLKFHHCNKWASPVVFLSRNIGK